jgi:hypothetical protein
MKTQIVIPDPLMADLRRCVPTRKRSHFIADAIERKLKSWRFRNALSRVAGAWTDANHPRLKTPADMDAYLSRFRARPARHG